MSSQAEIFIFDGVATRILKERNRVGLNQEEFARLGGASQPTQGRYEGGSPPKINYLAALAANGIDVMFILTGKRSNDALTPNEQILLGYFNKLNPQNQQIVIGMTSALTGDRSGMEWAIQSDD